MPAAPLYDIEAFRKGIQRNGPRRGYLLCGKEPYFHRLALDVLKAHYGSGSYEVHFPPQGGESPLPLGTLLAELVSPGLFGQSKLVAFIDAGKMLESKPQVLFDALAGSGPGTVAVTVTSGRIPKTITEAFQQYGEMHKTRKLYEKPGPWVRNPAPEKAELASWVVLRARSRGRTLAPIDAWELILRLGTELSELDQAVEKLALATPGKVITSEAVRTGIGHHRNYEVFELADAVLARDRGLALRLARRSLIEHAEKPEALLLILIAMLRRQLDDLVRVLELPGEPTPALLKEQLGINNKWRADRLLGRLPKFRSVQEVLDLKHLVYEADRDLKQGLAQADWLIERVVYGFC